MEVWLEHAYADFSHRSLLNYVDFFVTQHLQILGYKQEVQGHNALSILHVCHIPIDRKDLLTLTFFQLFSQYHNENS